MRKSRARIKNSGIPFDKRQTGAFFICKSEILNTRGGFCIAAYDRAFPAVFKKVAKYKIRKTGALKFLTIAVKKNTIEKRENRESE